TQSGVELIGGDPKKADLEILNLAMEALTALETGDFRFEIGDSALFKILISRVTSDEEETEAIREYIENKNIPELKSALEKYGDSDDAKALYSLPRLFGGIEIYDRALDLFKDKEMFEVLRDIKQAYDYLCYLGFEDKVTLDLGLVNKANYYTGLLFRGYIEGYGMPVLSGGRYDALMGDFGSEHTATGFAVNVNAVARVLLKNNTASLIKPAEVLVYSDSDAAAQGVAYCRELVSKDICAENSIQNSLEEALDYGRKKGIGKIAKVDLAGKVEEIKIL
ncbi:MAG: ATP phosphoribosyltransferase regulatory subunit, partial [Ruminiclostridium sp.]|nr:ATP phosphoribosyltransferase regulatory subunit [Ruminiclostridium sp.]